MNPLRINQNQWLGLKIIDLPVRWGLAWVLLSNAPVGTWIPLDSLGLDARSFQFLDSLWSVSVLMPLVKIIEAITGLALVLNRHVLLAATALVPIWVGICLVTAEFFPQGLWRNFSFLCFTLFLIFIRRHEVRYVENRIKNTLFYFRNPARSH